MRSDTSHGILIQVKYKINWICLLYPLTHKSGQFSGKPMICNITFIDILVIWWTSLQTSLMSLTDLWSITVISSMLCKLHVYPEGEIEYMEIRYFLKYFNLIWKVLCTKIDLRHAVFMHSARSCPVYRVIDLPSSYLLDLLIYFQFTINGSW